MDFGQAALLIALVYAITRWFGTIVTPPSWVTPIIAMSIAVGAVFLVAETVWAPENIVSGHALDNLDWASKLVAGVLLGAGANVLDQGIKAVRNVGENEN